MLGDVRQRLMPSSARKMQEDRTKLELLMSTVPEEEFLAKMREMTRRGEELMEKLDLFGPAVQLKRGRHGRRGCGK